MPGLPDGSAHRGCIGLTFVLSPKKEDEQRLRIEIASEDAVRNGA